MLERNDRGVAQDLKGLLAILHFPQGKAVSLEVVTYRGDRLPHFRSFDSSDWA
jgi:hypothetical protein